MPRRMLYVADVDQLYMISGAAWHREETDEEREHRWLVCDMVRRLIICSGVGLTGVQQEVLVLFLDGDSFVDIGDQMGMTDRGAKYHFDRAIDKIQVYLGLNTSDRDL